MLTAPFALSLRRPGDGQSFPIDRAKLERLRAVTREIRLVRPRDEGPRVRY